MNPKDLVGAKKAALGVVPPALLLGAAPAMAVGANKYGPFNWREQPVQAMTYVEAILRHLYAWMDGQEVAEDTGVNHLGHAAAGLGILMDAQAMGNLLDNRPAKGPAADMLREQDKSAPSETLGEAANRLGFTNPPVLGPAHQTETWDEAGQTQLEEFVAAWEAMKDAPPPKVTLFRSEPWGAGDGTVYGQPRSAWDRAGMVPAPFTGTLVHRCCGASDHTLDCPQYR